MGTVGEMGFPRISCGTDTHPEEEAELAKWLADEGGRGKSLCVFCVENQPMDNNERKI